MKQATINEEKIAEFNKKFQMVNFEQMLSNYGPKEKRRELFARDTVKLFGLDPEAVNIKIFFDLMVLSDQKIFQFP